MTHAAHMVASLRANNAAPHLIAIWESIAAGVEGPVRADDGGLGKALEASTAGLTPRAGSWVPEGPWTGLQDSIVAANQARLREIDRD